jgi:hypothetical protein
MNETQMSSLIHSNLHTDHRRSGSIAEDLVHFVDEVTGHPADLIGVAFRTDETVAYGFAVVVTLGRLGFVSAHQTLNLNLRNLLGSQSSYEQKKALSPTTRGKLLR